MKKYSIMIVVIALVAVAIFLVSCGKSDDKYIGAWQDTSDSSPAFTISKSDKGLVLQATGESATIEVSASGDSLSVDGTTFTFDEQKQELSAPGLFDSKITFKKAAGEQK